MGRYMGGLPWSTRVCMFIIRLSFMLWYLNENTVDTATTGALVHEPYQI